MLTPAPNLSIVCASSRESQRLKAFGLARKLNLPLQENINDRYKLHLVYTDYRLELQYNPLLLDHKEHPVYVDFLQGEKIHHRIATSSTRSPLAKAAGLKAGWRPTIADATAGLGMDSIVLAWLGCMVVLIERNPIIYALLQDGLERAGNNQLLRSVIAENIQLVHEDSAKILALLKPPVQCILVDPMFPQKKKGPLNRKEMRLVRAIAGDDIDSSALFRAALESASSRVVIKRPKGAQAICADPSPSYSVPMKSGRFDVYLTR
ncbi:MAG TPA: class I SAM-dependent methyltransferase [Desulfopila sp.]|nr:class I SAM-dependent methyltransferase [Desulfopila sp.]